MEATTKQRSGQWLGALSDLVDAVVLPADPDLDLPPASVAAWVTNHFAVIVVYLMVLVGGARGEGWWWAAMVGVWLVGLSGLCARLVVRLLHPASAEAPTGWFRGRGGGQGRGRGRGRVGVDVKLGLFAVTTYAAYLAAGQLGSHAVGGFLAVLALTTGLRLAGLDAWAGRTRPPWFYLRALWSWSGLGAAAVVVGAAALVFGLAILTVHPWLAGPEATVEHLIHSELSPTGQLRTISLGAAVLAFPVLMVCEAIAALNRHEVHLAQRLADHERRIERDGIARDIHDGVILSTLSEIRRLAADPGQIHLIDGLEAELRRLQMERLPATGHRPLMVSLRRPLQQANRRGLAVSLDTNPAALTQVVDGAVGLLVERLVMLQVTNSADAGAGQARLKLRAGPEAVTVTYVDDGGGFDPALIDGAGGGLARVRVDIERWGGSLRFRQARSGPHGRWTVARARLAPGGGAGSGARR